MPHMHQIIEESLAELRDRTGWTSLNILETGTIRNTGEEYRVGDGWSTVAFAKDIEQNGGALVSIDLDVRHAEKVLGDEDLLRYVDLVTGYSIEVMGLLLTRKPKFEVILLDSDNDAQLILHELMLARTMALPGALLLIDDIAMPGTSGGADKGTRAIPYLKSLGIEHEIHPRDGGTYSTGFCVAWL